MTTYFVTIAQEKERGDVASKVKGLSPSSYPNAGPIEKAREFIRKVGRPKVVKDLKKHRREYMRKWRKK